MYVGNFGRGTAANPNGGVKKTIRRKLRHDFDKDQNVGM